MSGVPVMCSWARLSFTVLWALVPVTTMPMPKAISRTLAAMPAYLKNFVLMRGSFGAGMSADR